MSEPRHVSGLERDAIERLRTERQKNKLHLRVGDRVRVKENASYTDFGDIGCREGVVVEARPENGGVLVLHDDGKNGGWGYSELELLTERLPWDGWPLGEPNLL